MEPRRVEPFTSSASYLAEDLAKQINLWAETHPQFEIVATQVVADPHIHNKQYAYVTYVDHSNRRDEPK